jgi:D-alanine-D-alanine ligase-like ATP-grasp enzyme
MPHEGAGFCTADIPKRREYRVHTFCGKAFRSGTKRQEDGTFHNDDKLIWNEDHGFVIKYSYEAPDAALSMAVKATKACKLDFGGVDILEGKDGELYLLEINTAPGMGPYTAAAYADQIIRYAKEQ